MTVKRLRILTITAIALVFLWVIVWGYGWWQVRKGIADYIANDTRITVTDYAVRGFPARYDIHLTGAAFDDGDLRVESESAVLNTLLYDRSQYRVSLGGILTIHAMGDQYFIDADSLRGSLRLEEDLMTLRRFVIEGQDAAISGAMNLRIDEILLASERIENQDDSFGYRHALRLASPDIEGEGDDVIAGFESWFIGNPFVSPSAYPTAIEAVDIDARLQNSRVEVVGSLDFDALAGALNISWQDWQNDAALLESFGVPRLALLALGAISVDGTLALKLVPVVEGVALEVAGSRVFTFAL